MKKVLSLSALIISTSLLTGCVIHVGGDEGKRANVSLTEETSIDANGVSKLFVEAGAGSLSIIGKDDVTAITAKAKIKTTEDENYTFTLERSGDKAYLVAEQDTNFGFYWIGGSPYIDLEVTVPSNIALDLEDGSGDILVKNINKDTKIVDGSGDIEVRYLASNLELDDGSGSIDIENVGGNLKLDDGSGSILIEQIGGNVDIDDGSGEMSILNVTGKVIIEDGSGDIEVLNAGGFELLEGGSGGLKIKNIKGAVDIDD